MGRRPSWRTADAIGYRSWLEREAFRAADAGEPIPRPLRAVEEWLLWRDAADTEEAVGEGSALLAESLARAARLMSEWRIPRRVLEHSGSEECERLARALERVEGRCREAHAAPSHALLALLEDWIARRRVVFAGFAQTDAGRPAWIRSALERSTAVREHVPQGAPGRVLAARAADPVEELELAALWCREQLAADSSRRLLVVVPDLASRRAEALRALEQTLTPQQVLGAPREEGVVNVEGGEPLGGYPLVRHAMTALGLLAGTLEIEVLSAWLRSAFWRLGGSDRARLDAWLRRILAFEVAPRDVLAALGTAPGALAGAAGTLRSVLQGALDAFAGATEPAPMGLWAQRFARALEALGWPGARAESSLEQQTRVRFGEVLSDLAATAGRVGAVAAPRAVRLLEALLARTTFAPASGESAVTLTGALTDPIVHYDGIFVAGLHADAWPQPPAANPFIPLGAQRTAGIPVATAAGSLVQARWLLERWSRCARELVLSWPERLEDCACLPSPLLQERHNIEAWTASGRTVPLARLVRTSRRVESFEDARGSVWPSHVPLPTGTRALDLQSRCPFRAYGELRLGALPLETPRPGIDPRERGRLLHSALELLWENLHGSEGLDERHAKGELERLIEDCVARAAARTRDAGCNAAPALAADAPAGRPGERREMRRAARLLGELAALERERPPFRVRDLERSFVVVLAGAGLQVRVDRIDELDDGTLAILDYKTGKPGTLDWLGERLGDPQLLVYALAAGAPASALVQVQLTAGAIALRGLADRRGRLPKLHGLSSDAQAAGAAWHKQIARWRAQLERLAGDFTSGAAAVDPAPSACRLCHLHTFCRVSEARAQREPPAQLDPREDR
jgi:ATP-dependent helicase/nuclease subunit B